MNNELSEPGLPKLSNSVLTVNRPKSAKIRFILILSKVQEKEHLHEPVLGCGSHLAILLPLHFFCSSVCNSIASNPKDHISSFIGN